MTTTTTQPLFKVTYLNDNGRPCSDCVPAVIDAAEARQRLNGPRPCRFRLEPVAVVPAAPAKAAAALKAVRSIARRRNKRTADGMLFTKAENKRLEKIQSGLRGIRFCSRPIGTRGKVEISGASGAAVDLRYPRVHPGAERRHIEPVAIVPLPATQRRAAMRLLKAAA